MTSTELVRSVYAGFAHVWKLADEKVKSIQQRTDTAGHLRPMQG